VSGAYGGVLAILSVLGALLGGQSAASSTPTKAEWRAMGHTQGVSGTLRNGCHYYSYHYSISPPTSEWNLNVFVRDPKGRNVATSVTVSGADKTSGTERFQLCRVTTSPGRFTLNSQLSYQDYPDKYTGWIAQSHFTLRKP
jgi:hypothetical protein